MNCPSCGRQNPTGADRCAGCGSALAGGHDSTYDDAPTVGGATMPPGAVSGPGASTGTIGRGTRLGNRYEILAVLGQGGMGTVYKAHDRELNRTVALKVIKPDLASRPPILERFKREILLASQVTHKNVLRIHDLGEAGDIRFISMNYVEGTDLASVLKLEGPLPLERSLPMMRQIVEALQAAHDAGVVHRDLKPQNILIDAKGNAYIADFGISRSLMMEGGTMTETGQVLGTIDYMSPEQARGETADHRSDIYSLGVIMYEVFTGSLPFQGSNSLSVMMKRVHQDAPTIRQSRPQFPLWLSSIVGRAMKREPGERYQSVADLLRDIDRQRASIAWRRLLGRRALVAAGALVVVAAAAFGAASFLRFRPSGPTGPVTSLAVMPFRNETGDPNFDWARTGLPDLLRRDLMQSKALRLASEDRIEDLLATLKVPDGEESRPATLQRVADFTSVDNVVSGSLMRAGDQFRIKASLRGVTGSSVGEEIPLSAEGRGQDSIFAMMDDLASRIRVELGASGGWGDSDRGAKDLSTSSIQALRLYSEGRALMQAGNQTEAARRLEAAVTEDQDFAVAHALLAETWDRLGYTEKAVGSAEKAAQGLGRTSAYEASRIRAVRARLADDLPAAEKHFRELCELAPNDPEALSGLASVLEESGQLGGAAESLQKAVSLDPHPDYRYALGRVQTKLGNLTGALKEFNTALNLHEDSGNEEGRATVLNGLGRVYQLRSEYEDAAKNFEEALEILERIGDRRGVRLAQENLAMTRGSQGRFDEAVELAGRSLQVAREIGDKPGEAEVLSVLGDLHESAGKPDEALRFYQESLAILRDIGDEASLARTQASMGYVNMVLGRYVEAFFPLKEALAKRRTLGERNAILRSLADIGVVEQVQGRYEEALRYYVEGLSLARDTGEKAGAVVIKANLSNIHEDQGEYAMALSLLGEGLAGAVEVGDESLVATCHAYLGSVRVRLGDLKGAQAALEEAVRIGRKLGQTAVLAEALTSLGALRLAESRGPEASSLLKEAVSEAKRAQDRRLILLATLQEARAARSVAELEADARESEMLRLMPIVGRARLALAQLHHAAGRLKESLIAAQQALQDATPLRQSDLLFQAHHLAGKILQSQGKGAEALEHYEAAAALLEQMRHGLEPDDLASFLGRAETSSFGDDATRLARALGRGDLADRLSRLLRS